MGRQLRSILIYFFSGIFHSINANIGIFCLVAILSVICISAFRCVSESDVCEKSDSTSTSNVTVEDIQEQPKSVEYPEIQFSNGYAIDFKHLMRSLSSFPVL